MNFGDAHFDWVTWTDQSVDCDLRFIAHLFSSAFAASIRSFATMLKRSVALLCVFAAANFARADELRRLAIGDLSAGSRLEVATADCVYRAKITNPATGEARMAASTDGVKFSEPQTVFLLGSTQGRSVEAGGLMFVKMNQLQTGMRIELGLGSMEACDRYLTEPIRSIRAE